MHPRLSELVNHAAAQRARLLSAVSLIPEPRRQQRAQPDCWSTAEVLEHLHRVERSVVRLLAHGLERATAEGIGPEIETESVVHWLDGFQLVRRTSRISAPEWVRPRGESSAAQALAALAESRQALLTAIGALDGLALDKITQSHPLLGSLNLYQWILFVGQHEARHAAQIEEIAGQLAASPDHIRG
jgi:uncharacterized damage-inducible protein DinB